MKLSRSLAADADATIVRHDLERVVSAAFVGLVVGTASTSIRRQRHGRRRFDRLEMATTLFVRIRIVAGLDVVLDLTATTLIARAQNQASETTTTGWLALFKASLDSLVATNAVFFLVFGYIGEPSTDLQLWLFVVALCLFLGFGRGVSKD